MDLKNLFRRKSPLGANHWGCTSFDVARSVSMTQDHGLCHCWKFTEFRSMGLPTKDKMTLWFLKYDAEGVLEWQQTIGGSEIDFLYDAVELEDQTIIAVGESSSSDGDIYNKQRVFRRADSQN